MFVGRCCACAKGDINGFWVRPGIILSTSLNDIGTEYIPWENITTGVPPYTLYTQLDINNYSAWIVGEKRLTYGIRLATTAPASEQQIFNQINYLSSIGSGGVIFPFAQGRNNSAYAVPAASVIRGGAGSQLALTAAKQPVCDTAVNVEQGKISHIVHPFLAVGSGSQRYLACRLAYYRIRHNGVAVTDILQAFDDNTEFTKVKPVAVSGFGVNATPSVNHGRYAEWIDETSTPVDSNFLYTLTNTTNRMVIKYGNQFGSMDMDNTSITIRLCEARAGVLTTSSDTPSGITATISLWSPYAGTPVTLTTIIVPVTPTTYTINLTSAQIEALNIDRIFAMWATYFDLWVTPSAVSGSSVAVIQSYVNVPTDWLYRVELSNDANNVSFQRAGYAPLSAYPQTWQIPEYLQTYTFKKNVEVSYDLWFELIKRNSEFGTFSTPSIGGIQAKGSTSTPISPIGFGVKYISKFDKTKHTWRLTFEGNTYRPILAIGDELKFSNWPVTVNSQYGDIDDTYAIASTGNEFTNGSNHNVGFYWNAEVPTLVLDRGGVPELGYKSQIYYPAASTVSVTKDETPNAPNYRWIKDHDPSGFWNPAVPTVFKLHRGVVFGAPNSPTLPSFAAADDEGYPTQITVQRVPAKRVVTRLYTRNQNWKSPSALLNVTEVLVECWGGGGSGGRSSGNTAADFDGGSGGGGAYSRSLVSVDPETFYTLVIGTLGTTPLPFGSNGTDGGNTSFRLTADNSIIVEAEGGKGGTGGTSTSGTGGIGGRASVGTGTVRYSGGNGLNGALWGITTAVNGGGSGGWEADGVSPTGFSLLPVAVKHGSGSIRASSTIYPVLSHGMGGGASLGSIGGGAGLVRISYEHENVDITERRFTQSTTWTAPDGVTTVNVQCWAAGGGSGGTDGYSGSASGGGGGGAYVWKTVTVVPLTEYTIEVGRGGDGGFVDGSTVTNGEDGGDSWFSTSSTVKAAGGKGGTSATLDDDEAGGAGGLASDSVGEEKWSGGDGADGLSTSYGGGGGSSASNGSDGSPGSAGTGGVAPSRGGSGGDAGFVGRFPGGGGGGVQGTGSSDVPPVAGQSGGDGLVILQYAV